MENDFDHTDEWNAITADERFTSATPAQRTEIAATYLEGIWAKAKPDTQLNPVAQDRFKDQARRFQVANSKLFAASDFDPINLAMKASEGWEQFRDAANQFEAAKATDSRLDAETQLESLSRFKESDEVTIGTDAKKLPGSMQLLATLFAPGKKKAGDYRNYLEARRDTEREVAQKALTDYFENQNRPRPAKSAADLRLENAEGWREVFEGSGTSDVVGLILNLGADSMVSSGMIAAPALVGGALGGPTGAAAGAGGASLEVEFLHRFSEGVAEALGGNLTEEGLLELFEDPEKLATIQQNATKAAKAVSITEGLTNAVSLGIAQRIMRRSTSHAQRWAAAAGALATEQTLGSAGGSLGEMAALIVQGKDFRTGEAQKAILAEGLGELIGAPTSTINAVIETHQQNRIENQLIDKVAEAIEAQTQMEPAEARTLAGEIRKAQILGKEKELAEKLKAQESREDTTETTATEETPPVRNESTQLNLEPAELDQLTRLDSESFDKNWNETDSPQKRQIVADLGLPARAPTTEIQDALQQRRNDLDEDPTIVANRQALGELITHLEETSTDGGSRISFEELGERPTVAKFLQDTGRTFEELQPALEAASPDGATPGQILASTIPGYNVKEAQGFVVRLAQAEYGQEDKMIRTAIRDYNQAWTKRALENEELSIDSLVEWKQQLETLFNGEKSPVQGWQGRDDADSVIEWLSEVAYEYTAGRAPDVKTMPEKVRQFFRWMAEMVSEVVRRGLRLRKAFDEGKLDSEFERVLSESTGLERGTQNAESTEAEFLPEGETESNAVNPDLDSKTQMRENLKALTPRQREHFTALLGAKDWKEANAYLGDERNVISDDVIIALLDVKPWQEWAEKVMETRASKQEGRDFRKLRVAGVHFTLQAQKEINETGKLSTPNFTLAWHGSPHDIDQFSTDHIGNGEGNQAFGWGLYFAQNPEVGEFYKNSLEGSLYEVDLKPDPVTELAQWDAPLSDHPKVLEVFLNLAPTESVNGFPSARKVLDVRLRTNPDFTVGAAHDLLAYGAGDLGIEPIAKALLDSGIRGVRFLDGVSRGEGEGSYNYVIFDGADVEIVSKNGEKFSPKPPLNFTLESPEELSQRLGPVMAKDTVEFLESEITTTLQNAGVPGEMITQALEDSVRFPEQITDALTEAWAEHGADLSEETIGKVAELEFRLENLRPPEATQPSFNFTLESKENRAKVERANRFQAVRETVGTLYGSTVQESSRYSEKGRRIRDQFAKTFHGVEVYFTDTEGGHVEFYGVFVNDGDAIVVNSDTSDEFTQSIAGHELGHRMQYRDFERYQKLANLISPLLTPESIAIERERMRLAGYGPDEIDVEIINNAFGDFFANPEFLEAIGMLNIAGDSTAEVWGMSDNFGENYETAWKQAAELINDYAASLQPQSTLGNSANFSLESSEAESILEQLHRPRREIIQITKARLQKMQERFRDEKANHRKDTRENREALVADLKELQAIQSNLPLDVRGKLGGFATLATLVKHETRQKFLENRAERALELLDGYRQKAAIESIHELLTKTEKKLNEQKRKSKGKLGGEGHAFFDQVESAVELTADEQAEKLRDIQEKLNRPDLTESDQMDLVESYEIVSRAGNLRNQTADQLEALVPWLEDAFTAFRTQRRILEQARREKLAEKRDQIIASAGAENPSLNEIAEAERAADQVFGKTGKVARNMDELLDLAQVMQRAAPDNAIAEALGKDMKERAQRTDMRFVDAQDRFNKAAAKVFGIDRKKFKTRASFRRAVTNRLADLQVRDDKSGVYFYKHAGKLETIPLSHAKQIAAGRKTFGYSAEQVKLITRQYRAHEKEITVLELEIGGTEADPKEVSKAVRTALKADGVVQLDEITLPGTFEQVVAAADQLEILGIAKREGNTLRSASQTHLIQVPGKRAILIEGDPSKLSDEEFEQRIAAAGEVGPEIENAVRDLRKARFPDELRAARENAKSATTDAERAKAYVTQWSHAGNPEAAEVVAAELETLPGVERIANEGDELSFQGAYHISTDPLFPGDAAKITRHGYLFRDESGELLLEKARAIKATNSHNFSLTSSNPDSTGMARRRLAGMRRRKNLEVQFLGSGLEQQSLTQMEALMDWLTLDQPHYEAQAERIGYPPKAKAQLEAFLTDEAKALGLYMRDELRGLGTDINRVFESINGVNMAMHDNYFPGIFEKQGEDSRTVDPFSAEHNVGGFMDGFTSYRVPHGARRKRIAALPVFLGHLESAFYYVEFAEAIRDLGAIFSHPDTQAAIKVGRGAQINSILQGWLKIARGGGSIRAEIRTMESDFVHSTTGRFSAAALAWNVGTMLVNSSNWLLALTRMSQREFWGTILRLKNPVTFWKRYKRIYDGSDIGTRREVGATPEIRSLMRMVAPRKTTAFSQLAQSGMAAINFFDASTLSLTMTIAYDNAHHKAKGLPQHIRDIKGQEAAHDVFLASQQPNNWVDRSYKENIKNPMAKLSVYMFISDPRRALSNVYMAGLDAVRRKDAASISRAATMFALYFLYRPTWEFLVRGLDKIAFGDEDDEEQFTKEGWLAEVTTGPVRGIPLFGQAYDLMIRAWVFDQYTNSKNPMLDAMTRAIKEAIAMFNPEQSSASSRSIEAFREGDYLDAIQDGAKSTKAVGAIFNANLGALGNLILNGAGFVDFVADIGEEIPEDRLTRMVREAREDDDQKWDAAADALGLNEKERGKPDSRSDLTKQIAALRVSSGARENFLRKALTIIPAEHHAEWIASLAESGAITDAMAEEILKPSASQSNEPEMSLPEKRLKNLGVSNGERAEAITFLLNDTPKDERTALKERLRRFGILTPAVTAQLAN